MHLLDRYALSCGVKIDKPFISEHYYPTTLDKYIVFQTSGKGNSRQYDYWTKVFSFIKEYRFSLGSGIKSLYFCLAIFESPFKIVFVGYS